MDKFSPGHDNGSKDQEYGVYTPTVDRAYKSGAVSRKKLYDGA